MLVSPVGYLATPNSDLILVACSLHKCLHVLLQILQPEISQSNSLFAFQLEADLAEVSFFAAVICRIHSESVKFKDKAKLYDVQDSEVTARK